MKTLSDLLRDADPLRHEPDRLIGQRDRLRRTVVAAASGPTIQVSGRRRGARSLLAVLAAAASILVGIAVGSRMWPEGGPALQAAVRFEVRLAEERPAPDLDEARVGGSSRVIYLHREIVVTNSDVAHSRVVEGGGPARFSVAVRLTSVGARRMRQATAAHQGKPLAILIDGVVVTAPVVRSPIDGAALISGGYTEAEAQRIAGGISQ